MQSATPDTGEDLYEFDPDEQFANAAGDVRDPYPDFAVQRREQPIMRVDMRELMGLPAEAPDPDVPPMYTVFSHELVQEVLHDGERFTSTGYAEVMGQIMGHTILEMDAPEHIRHRNLVARAFRTKMLERWSDQLIGKTVDELIDRFADKGKADLVRGLTFPFPVKVISRILGLPDADWPKFQRWSLELISVGVDFDRGMRASRALSEYFQTIIDRRRMDPQDDLISELCSAEVDGHVLTDEEIFSFLKLLLPAGAETTYRSSGNLLFGLLTHTDQMDALIKDRSLLPQAIEEALRWEPPLLFIMRSTSYETELGGMLLPKGAGIGVSLGAANRDENRYANPDEFDIFREPQLHMSFGFGPHMCLGMHLARLETKIAINAVLDRLPNLRLDPDGDDPHIHGLTFRSPTSLPVLFG